MSAVRSPNGRAELHAAEITTIWFDLDATLYSIDTGLWAQIGQRIESYLLNVMRFPPDRLKEMKLDYFTRYGTTLRGLQLNQQVDTRDYLNYVHDVPVREYLQPDPELRALLLALPQSRWVFTNSDQGHAERVLDALAIRDCFTGLITVESLEFECKPNRPAYEAALRISQETDPRRVLFLDDSARNLAAAHKLGIRTILVDPQAAHPDYQNGLPAGVDLALRRPHDLLAVMPNLIRPIGQED